MEIVGEILGHDGDEVIWDYFRRHWAAWFPGLGDFQSTKKPEAIRLTGLGGILLTAAAR